MPICEQFLLGRHSHTGTSSILPPSNGLLCTPQTADSATAPSPSVTDADTHVYAVFVAVLVELALTVVFFDGYRRDLCHSTIDIQRPQREYSAKLPEISEVWQNVPLISEMCRISVGWDLGLFGSPDHSIFT